MLYTVNDTRSTILTASRNRYATKKFDASKKISKEDWEVILEAGRLSPSSFGYEPWKFLLINNDDIKNELKKDSWGAINSLNGASHFVIILARKHVTSTSEHVKHMVNDVFKSDYSVDSTRTKLFEKFQNEDFQLSTDQKIFDWASKQTYIPLANMMTAAAMLGIDSCPIEGFNQEAVERYLESKHIIDSSKFGVSVMLGLGYRDEEKPEKKRQSIEEILTIID